MCSVYQLIACSLVFASLVIFILYFLNLNIWVIFVNRITMLGLVVLNFFNVA
jgi:hypothetical protein